MGWLADRIPKKFVMVLIYSLVAAAIPLLYFASTPGVIYVFAFIFGIALGGDYMIIPLMTAEIFSIRIPLSSEYGRINPRARATWFNEID